MKKMFILLLLIGVTLFFSSCALHSGLTGNINNHTTEVVLSKKNFKIIAKVQGKAEATYVFGIGGLSKEALITEARANMLSKADIVGSSKAIINETVEIKRSVFFPIVPLIYTHKVIVSGYIIEFTE